MGCVIKPSLIFNREGDLVTITDRNDLQMALKELVEQADRLAAQHGGPKLPNMIPPLRIHATRAKSEVSCYLWQCSTAHVVKGP